MKKVRLLIGIAAIAIAAITSAFTTRQSLGIYDQLWFNPTDDYAFQFYGTTTEAMDFLGATTALSIYPASVGYLYVRHLYPYHVNPFAHIEYDAFTLDPTYGSTLRMTSGYPSFPEDEQLYY
jgi:hypothetical protein